ncbi:cupin domain-containing protein [Acidithrix sp. C25]|uniref:cupin domain-containing protein n=1 Tax=Acidithrix sp. C25 TaxID=1671482 RepID=UPI00191BB26B|nr:cupin domain-containing protein [Acidithrix sp. C25]CAG4934929.1 unnamed protein product [Acidithrix sp. C25]
MKIVELGETFPIRPERYSGDVAIQALRVSPNPADGDILHVQYEPNCVTNWHRHPGGQFIYILSESAIIGVEGEEPAHVKKGSLVVVTPGERHWHGATVNDPAEILTFTFGITKWEDASITK